MAWNLKKKKKFQYSWHQHHESQ